MLPEIWGRHAWNFIHLMTLGYPQKPTETEKMQYRNFFYSLIYVLPCKKCRVNLAKNINKYPLTDTVLSSRNSFVKWGIDLHNAVNAHTGKETLSYKDALNEINKLMNINKKDDYTIFYVILFVIIIIAIVWFYYTRS